MLSTDGEESLIIKSLPTREALNAFIVQYIAGLCSFNEKVFL